MRGFIKKHKVLLFLLAISFVLRVILAPHGTMETPDMNNFRAWSNHIANTGPGEFYDTIWADYTPGYMYMLWALGEIKNFFSIESTSILFILFKLPTILADIGTGVLIFIAVSKFNKKFAIPAVVLYLLNPAIFVNSALWGQIDGIIAFLTLAAVLFADTSPFVAVISLALVALIKPHTAIFAPFVGLLWLRTFGWWKSICYTFATAIVFLLGYLPFTSIKKLFPFVFESIVQVAGLYTPVSANAFNIWAIIVGIWKPDAGWPLIAGTTLFLLISIFTLVYWWKKEKKGIMSIPFRFLVLTIILAASFLFLTRIHERHLLPGFAPLSIAAAGFPLLWVSYSLFSPVYVANLRFAYVWLTQDFKWFLPQWAVTVLSLINLAAFAILGWVLFKQKTHFSKPLLEIVSNVKNRVGKIKIPEMKVKYWYVLIGIILLFAFVTRVHGLGYPDEFYFDEVYHAFTAQEISRGNADAWVWFSKPPKNRAYSWDHPPLPKVIMSWGVYLMGEKPIAWRLPGAILGVLCILLVYLIGMALLKNKAVSLLAAALFALDGLPLVLSRIGTNDIYILFFALGTIYFFLKDQYLFSAIFVGLAGSSKWSFIWLAPILLAIMIILKKRPGWWMVWFFIIPPLIYILSYISFFEVYTWEQFIHLQKQMYWYHTNLEATHPFTSPWWSWPLMLKPVWYFTTTENGLIYNIYAHGNPVVFWGGLLAVFAALAIAILSKKRELWVLLAAYIGFFVPWSLSPRIMFIYHYLPSVPFLCLILAWVLMANRRPKTVAIIFLCIVLLFFLFMYPRWIGLPVPVDLNTTLYGWVPA